MSNIEEPDTHFYLDNVSPSEAQYVLRALSQDVPQRPDEISTILIENYGFEMQKEVTYTPRRLFDLGIALVEKVGGSKSYRLSPLGARVQMLKRHDEQLIPDILHYLMYAGYSGNPLDRKNLWSYRLCCDQVWSRRQTFNPEELAAYVNTQIAQCFPGTDFNAKKGGRFNGTAVGCVYAWLRALNPSPIPMKKTGAVTPRNIPRPELALLAMTDTYRARGHAFGDALILIPEVTQKIAGVFFLEPATILGLLQQAAMRYPKFISLNDTIAGTGARLSQPFTVNDL